MNDGSKNNITNDFNESNNSMPPLKQSKTSKIKYDHNTNRESQNISSSMQGSYMPKQEYSEVVADFQQDQEKKLKQKEFQCLEDLEQEHKLLRDFMKQMNEHLSYLIEVNGKKMIAKKVATRKTMHSHMDNEKKLRLLEAKKENNEKQIQIRERENMTLTHKVDRFKSKLDSGAFQVEVENKKEMIKKLNKEIVNLRKNSNKYSHALVLDMNEGHKAKNSFEYDRLTAEIQKYYKKKTEFQDQHEKNTEYITKQEVELKKIQEEIDNVEKDNHQCSSDFTKSKLEDAITKYKKLDSKILILKDCIDSMKFINYRYEKHTIREMREQNNLRLELKKKINDKEMLTSQFKRQIQEMEQTLNKQGFMNELTEVKATQRKVDKEEKFKNIDDINLDEEFNIPKQVRIKPERNNNATVKNDKLIKEKQTLIKTQIKKQPYYDTSLLAKKDAVPRYLRRSAVAKSQQNNPGELDDSNFIKYEPEFEDSYPYSYNQKSDKKKSNKESKAKFNNYTDSYDNLSEHDRSQDMIGEKKPKIGSKPPQKPQARKSESKIRDNWEESSEIRDTGKDTSNNKGASDNYDKEYENKNQTKKTKVHEEDPYLPDESNELQTHKLDNNNGIKQDKKPNLNDSDDNEYVTDNKQIYDTTEYETDPNITDTNKQKVTTTSPNEYRGTTDMNSDGIEDSDNINRDDESNDYDDTTQNKELTEGKKAEKNYESYDEAYDDDLEENLEGLGDGDQNSKNSQEKEL